MGFNKPVRAGEVWDMCLCWLTVVWVVCRAFGLDKLNIFYLIQLGPIARRYITTLFNNSLFISRIHVILESANCDPCPKPGKETSQGTSNRPTSLFYPVVRHCWRQSSFPVSTFTCSCLLTKTDFDHGTTSAL